MVVPAGGPFGNAAKGSGITETICNPFHAVRFEVFQVIDRSHPFTLQLTVRLFRNADLIDRREEGNVLSVGKHHREVSLLSVKAIIALIK